MQEVDYPVLAPSVCVVCEGVPPETAFVDTGRTFEPGGFTHLNGRKYICESCVTDAAAALGLTDEAVAVVQAVADELAAKVAQLEADIENYRTVQTAIEALSQRPVMQVEDTVSQAVENAKARKQTRSKAAKDAQDARAEQDAAAAAGAAKQAEIDQAAADAQQAASEAALAGPAEPDAPVIPEADPLPQADIEAQSTPTQTGAPVVETPPVTEAPAS